MSIISHTASTFCSQTFAIQFTTVLPSTFRLGLQTEGLTGSVEARFVAFGNEIEVAVQGLLALAPLRHGGAPYSAQDAIVKETLLWFGWLGVHSLGGLAGRLLVGAGSNAGRQAEFSAGLAECLAVAVLMDIEQLPLSTIFRIPESGTAAEGMDFRTSGPGATAIEAKGGHGSCVGRVLDKIHEQMSRQTHAQKKFGLVLCFEKHGASALKRKGSYVHIFDPPDTPRDEEPPGRGVLRHYLQVCQAIGYWSLVDALLEALELPPRTSGDTGDALAAKLMVLRDLTLQGEPGSAERRQSLVRLAWRGPGICFAVDSRPYLGRFFQYEEALGLAEGTSERARPITFFGISLDVVRGLASHLLQPNDTRVLSDFSTLAFRERHRLRATKPGDLGDVYYTGLEDGVLRVDAISLSEVLTIDLNLQTQTPTGGSRRDP